MAATVFDQRQFFHHVSHLQLMEDGQAGDLMEAASRVVEGDLRPETEPVQTQHLVMVESTVEDLRGTRQSATLTNAVSLAQILFILHEFGLVGASAEKELISHKETWHGDGFIMMCVIITNEKVA